MTEQILKDYLDSKVSADILSNDLIGTVNNGRDISYYKITEIKSDDKFVVTTNHVIKICLDIISNKIKLEDLRAVAFALEASDYFTWDTNTKDGSKVDDAVSNWSTPENSKPTTMDYIKCCAYYLNTGEHR